MQKKKMPQILKVLGWAIIVYGIFEAYDLTYFIFIIRYAGFSVFFAPEFVLSRIIPIVMIVIAFMCGKILISGKKNTVEKFIKYGNIYLLLFIFPIIANGVSAGFHDSPAVYFRVFKILLGYFIVLFILNKNKSIKDYFQNIDENKDKNTKINKTVTEDIENQIILKWKKEEEMVSYKISKETDAFNKLLK